SMKTLSSPKVLVMMFLWLAIFGFVCQASSDAQNTTTLQRRQCAKDPATGQWDCDFNLPTLQEIVQRYRDTNNEGAATADRPVWFYTNLDLAANSAASLALCQGWMLSNQLDGYYVVSGLDLDWYHEQFDWIQEHRQQFVFAMAGLDPEVIFGECLFEAVALSAVHPEAYVFTKEAPEFWSIGSTWAMVEYPALTSNSNIQRIYRESKPGTSNNTDLPSPSTNSAAAAPNIAEPVSILEPAYAGSN
ncbi:hypothetical protein LTS13_001976, partial [Exophiala xenobiotica]